MSGEAVEVVAGTPMAGRPVAVSVVVAHYEGPRTLALVLRALEQQRDAPPFEVVIADDGSQSPPDPGPRPYAVRVVTQPDEGFRAAAVRNLGAAAARGEVLLFLDGDTVPEPGYVAAMCRAIDEGTLAVGRRRHADLAPHDPETVAVWLRDPSPDDQPDEDPRAGGGHDGQDRHGDERPGSDPAGESGSGDDRPREDPLVGGAQSGQVPRVKVLPEPAWLREAYDATDDLANPGALAEGEHTAYRFVISAVLGLRRGLWERLGGFDEGFVGYGGEDWELAHRAWLAGARLRHVRDAVAWHDGPDLAGRGDAGDRTLETVRVAERITAGVARHPGITWTHPAVSVDLDDRGAGVGEVLACCATVLHGSDARVWLRAGGALDNPAWPATETRVARGPEPAQVAARRGWIVTVGRPVHLTVPLGELVARGEGDYGGVVRVESTRALARGESAPPRRPLAKVAVELPEPFSLEAWWGWQAPR